MARPAERMNSARKRELAIEFIRKIRAMDRNKLHELILGEAGEELAQFFLMYATDLMMRVEHRPEARLVLAHVLEDPVPLEDLDRRKSLADSPLLH